MDDDEPLTAELTRSGIERDFLNLRGAIFWKTVVDCFPGAIGPFLNIDGGRNDCMLIRERRFAFGELDGSLECVIRSSTSAAEAAGAKSSRRLQTRLMGKGKYRHKKDVPYAKH